MVSVSPLSGKMFVSSLVSDPVFKACTKSKVIGSGESQ